jgi:hypothetical protein
MLRNYFAQGFRASAQNSSNENIPKENVYSFR